MADWHVFPSRLQGSISIPPSKSHTLRALFFASLSHGRSQIDHYLPSLDTQTMISALEQLGASIQLHGSSVFVDGFSGVPRAPQNVIQCHNSGIVFRFVGALVSLIPHYTVLTGDASIRLRRSSKSLVAALSQLGAFATTCQPDQHAPMIVRGPLWEAHAQLDGQDSQPVSGLLSACAFAPHPIRLTVTNPGETPWIDLTLFWLNRLGIACHHENYTNYELSGQARVDGFHAQIPGDWSSALFPIVAALVSHSNVTIQNVDMQDVQGDKQVLAVLGQMGAQIDVDESTKTLFISGPQSLRGITIDVNPFIDALPILAVLGCWAEGETRLTNAAIARQKESDRLSAIAAELKKMGALIEELPDGLRILHSPLFGAVTDSHKDHRIALSLLVAALCAKSSTVIRDVDCVAKSFPEACRAFCSLGARVE